MKNTKQTANETTNEITNEMTNDTEINTQTSTVYTEQQIKEAFNRGHDEGYIAAIHQIRRAISDYLIDLEISINLKHQS